VAARILATFWSHGYSATSLDQLAAATGLNRPSLYAAFGDKQGMYRRALAAFSATVSGEIAVALGRPRLREALTAFYSGAIRVYLEGEHGPRGCFVVCTAAVEAVDDVDIRSDLATILAGIDGALTARLTVARQAGELPAASDPEALARIAAAVLHSLAVRARAGAGRRSLQALARSAVELLCGAGSPAR